RLKTSSKTCSLFGREILKMVVNPNALQSAGGTPIPPGIILFGEPWRGRPPGAGAVYEGNIAWDLHPTIQTTPFPLYSSSTSFLKVGRSIIQGNQWPGIGNLTADPLFVSTTGIDYTTIRNALALQAGSPARGTGPNGLDMGATVPAGASVSGAPAGTSPNRDATLVVAGPGIWVYRWRLDGGEWSADVALVPASVLNGGIFSENMYDNPPPITLTNLPDGPHTVEVIGQNSAGDWQEIPIARTWTVLGDFDHDGMPDAWETAHVLDPNDPADAVLDADSDGQTNVREYVADTDPRDPNSRLTASATAAPTPGTIAITFNAVAGKSYTVRYKDDLTAAVWTVLQQFPVQSSTGPQTVLDTPPAGARQRFYHVVTPRQP
ncbi:MAG: hypothetical protein ABI680_16655, partial [Chthoniobacteraceae bacterium]